MAPNPRKSQLIALLIALISLFSEILAITCPQKHRDGPQRFELQPCRSIDAISRLTGDRSQFIQSRIIEEVCQRFVGNESFQLTGNYSLQNEQVRCSDNPVYSYNIANLHEKHLLRQDKAVATCKGLCAFVFASGDEIFLSQPVFRDTIESLFDRKNATLRFLKTRLFFDGSGLLQQFAYRLVDAFDSAVTSPEEIRRNVFLGSAERERECPFVVEDEPSDLLLGKRSLCLHISNAMKSGSFSNVHESCYLSQ